MTQPLRSRFSFAASAAAAAFALGAVSLMLAFPSRAFAADSPPAAAAAKQDKPKKPPAEDPEIKMGREAHEEMLKGGLKLVQDPKLVARVNAIGQKEAAIARVTKISASYGSDELIPYDYHFFIVDDPDVNAFSLPGGYIYINKGLINYVQSDDELAGVIGHEITHAAHHHVVKLQKEQNKLSNIMLAGMLAGLIAHVPITDASNVLQGFQLLAIQKVNGFGQTAEQDADHGGVIVTQKAGYNPVGMLTFMERLARDQRMRPDIELGIFRTHPPEKERVAAITSQLREMGVPIRRREVTNALKVETRVVTVGMPTTGTPPANATQATGPAAPGTTLAPPAATGAGLQATEVLLDGTVLYRTPSAERAKQAAATLNKLLDDDVQIYDVTKQGSSLLIHGDTVFTVVPEDLTLPGSYASTSVAVDAAYKNLRNALYKEFLVNTD